MINVIDVIKQLKEQKQNYNYLMFNLLDLTTALMIYSTHSAGLSIIDLNTHRDSLLLGYYANICGKSIWVNQSIERNNFRIYLKPHGPIDNKCNGWSGDIHFSQTNIIDRIIKLQTFS